MVMQKACGQSPADLTGRLLDLLMDRRLPHWFALAALRRLRYAPSTLRQDRPLELQVAITFDVEGDFQNPASPLASATFMPRFLQWSGSTGIRSTLYVQGSIVPAISDALRACVGQHELGLHGMNHEVWGRSRWWQSRLGLRSMPVHERAAVLEGSLKMFQRYELPRPTAFRAPYLNADRYTLRLLVQSGFSSDSSAPSYLGYLPVIRRIEGIIEIPVSAHPRPQLTRSIIAPFFYRDLSVGTIFKMDKTDFLNTVSSIVNVQQSVSSGQRPYIVILGHPWEFISGGGVAHASDGNFGMLDRALSWLSEHYRLKFVTIPEVCADV